MLQTFKQFGLGQALFEGCPTLLVAVPIGQTGVMPGNQIGNYPPHGAKLHDRVLRPDTGMIRSAAGSPDVLLKFTRILPEIMPDSGQPAPLGTVELCSKSLC